MNQTMSRSRSRAEVIIPVQYPFDLSSFPCYQATVRRADPERRFLLDTFPIPTLRRSASTLHGLRNPTTQHKHVKSSTGVNGLLAVFGRRTSRLLRRQDDDQRMLVCFSAAMRSVSPAVLAPTARGGGALPSCGPLDLRLGRHSVRKNIRPNLHIHSSWTKSYIRP